MNIDLGDFQSFRISPEFFKSVNEWIVVGSGIKKDVAFSKNDSITEFHIRSGQLVFSKMNFKPKGELYIVSLRETMESDTFDYLTSLCCSRLINSLLTWPGMNSH